MTFESKPPLKEEFIRPVGTPIQTIRGAGISEIPEGAITNNYRQKENLKDYVATINKNLGKNGVDFKVSEEDLGITYKGAKKG